MGTHRRCCYPPSSLLTRTIWRKNFWDGVLETVFVKGKAHSGLDSGNGVPVNHSKEDFFRQRRRNIDASPSPSCEACVTLEKEMAISGQDLDGLWLYDDHDMDVYLLLFWFPPPLLRKMMRFQSLPRFVLSASL